MKILRHAVVMAALLVSGIAPTLAAPTVVDPALPVAGHSQLSLSEQWWQWALGIPLATNPIADPDGRFSAINNGGLVFFIAGTFGGSVTRNISIAEGRPVFFPIQNGIWVDTPKLPVAQYGPNCLNQVPGDNLPDDPVVCALSFISPGQEDTSSFFARLDGVNLLTFPSFRQISTAYFDVVLGDGNAFNLPNDVYPSVADGHWVALTDLPVGPHLLEFGASWESVRANLTVPEPSSALALLAGLGALGLGRRRGLGTVQG